MGQFMLTGIGSIFSSTIEWFGGLFSKGRGGVKNQPNGTDIYGTAPVRLHCQPQEKDVPEELVCNPGESRFNPYYYYYKPTSNVSLSRNPHNKKVRTHFKQRHSIHNKAQHDIVHDPNASESNPISIKKTSGVEKYMNDGLYEEELVAVLRKQLPFYDFHGMIREDEIRNQKRKGSYLIRSSTVTSEIDHCTAMILENDNKEYFDPSGELPLNLKNFFTEYNRRQLQSSKYNTCGYHCAYYLIARNKGLTMDQFIASYPGNLQENDRMVTENFIKLHDNSRIIVENQE